MPRARTHCTLLACFLCSITIAAESTLISRQLEGLKLNCCAVLQSPNLFNNSNRLPYKLDGLAMDYLDQLEAQLGFSCGSMQVITSPDDVAFSSFINKMHNCSTGSLPKDNQVCQCEIGIGGWWRLSTRNRLVHFLPGFSETQLRVIVNRKDAFPTRSAWFIVTAMHPTVWILGALLVLILVFLKFLDRKFEPMDMNDDDPEFFAHLRSRFWTKFNFRRFKFAFFDALYEFTHAGNYTHRGVYENAPLQTCLSLLIIVTGIVFMVLYEAALVAQLIVDDVQADFRTIEDLRLCNIPPNDVCIPRGGALEQYWLKAIASDSCHQGNPAQFVSSYEQAVERLVKRDCRYLLAGSSAEGVASGKDCRKVAIVGEPLLWNSNSFVLPLQADPTLLKALEQETLSLRERGRLQTITEVFKARGTCPGIERSGQLELRDLSAFFILAGAAAGLLFLAILIQR